MDIMRYDFTAPEGKHFGIIQTAEQALAAIPNMLDIWTPRAENMTLVGGAISRWTGHAGQQFIQNTAAFRPVLQGSEIFFGDGAGAHKGFMVLDGTQIGAITNLTIAGRFRLPQALLATDVHFMFGMQNPNFRMAYRYINANNLVRFDTASPNITNVDCDLPSGVDTISLIFIISGSTSVRLICGDTEVTATLGAQQSLPAFTLGTTSLSAGDWPGWIGNFGIWRHAANANQIALLKSWLA